MATLGLSPNPLTTGGSASTLGSLAAPLQLRVQACVCLWMTVVTGHGCVWLPSTVDGSHWLWTAVYGRGCSVQLSMVVYGCPSLWMVVLGCGWLHMAVKGCGWFSMVVDGCPWLWLVVCGCRWLWVVLYGCGWLSLVVVGCGWL